METDYDFHIFYKTVNKLNGRFYFGIHSTNNLDDGYLGSGNGILNAINKYGRENFYREVLFIETTRDKVFEIEALVVDDEMLADDLCYNICYGGRKSIQTEEMKQKIRETLTGRPIPQEVKEKISESMKSAISDEEKKARSKRASGTNNPQWKGYWHTPLGVFLFSQDAATANNISDKALRKRCKNCDKLMPINGSVPREVWGKTWRENGFWFEPKERKC